MNLSTLVGVPDAILIHINPENWKRAKEITGILNKPFVPAGGLNLDNIEEVVKIFKPFCIDLSRGVESQPGKKDFHKVEKLIEKVKKCYNKA